MSNTVYKFQRTGNGLKERLIIKGFKYRDDMHKFLSTGSNSLSWKEGDKKFPELKAGTYLFAGGKWHNVKKCDALTLAHC